MIPISLIIDDPFSLSPELTPTLAMIGLTVFSTAIASLIFFRLIKTLGSLATTSNAYLRALFSVLLGVIFLSEPLSWNIIFATVLIFIGVALVSGQANSLFRTKSLDQKD